MAGVVAPRLRVGLHVSQLIQPIPGGIGRVTQLLCDELPKYVDVVPFAVGSRHDRAGLETRLAPAIELHRVLGLPSIRWQYELWRHLRRPRVHLNIDVCHAPSLALPPTSAALVVSINDVAFLRHPETFATHGLRFHMRALATAHREAAAIIVPSQFTRDELVREGFDRGRIHCVPLAIQPVPDVPSNHRPDVFSMMAIQTPYVFTAGTLEPRKDHATLLTAFERARIRQPSLSLVIAGPTGWLPNEGMYSKPGVIRLGHISNSHLDVLYRKAAIVVAPSIYEGFDLVVLEAMARGRPVIASRIPPHVELAGNAARFFPPRDVDSLAQCIDESVGADLRTNDVCSGFARGYDNPATGRTTARGRAGVCLLGGQELHRGRARVRARLERARLRHLLPRPCRPRRSRGRIADKSARRSRWHIARCSPIIVLAGATVWWIRVVWTRDRRAMSFGQGCSL